MWHRCSLIPRPFPLPAVGMAWEYFNHLLQYHNRISYSCIHYLIMPMEQLRWSFVMYNYNNDPLSVCQVHIPLTSLGCVLSLVLSYELVLIIHSRTILFSVYW